MDLMLLWSAIVSFYIGYRIKDTDSEFSKWLFGVAIVQALAGLF